MSSLPSSESPIRLYYSPDLNAYFFKYSHARKLSTHVEDVTTRFRYWTDPRPLMPSDLKFLREAHNLPLDTRQAFTSIVKSCTTIVNVNNDSVLDLVLEFMCNGEILCTVNYDMFTESFMLIPGKLGASILLKEDCCNVVITDEHASKILEVREKMEHNLYVAVTPDGRTCGSGIRRGKKIVIARKWIPDYPEKVLQVLSRRRTTYRELYELNREYIEERIVKTRRVVEYFEKRHGRKGILSFSGGKDSLLALHLLVEAGTNSDIVHVAIENGDPPHLTDYVHDIARRLGVNIEILETRWSKIERYLRELGMPTRGNRWCTPLLKFTTMLRYIKHRYGLSSIVSYVGSRKSETLKRSIRPATYIDSEAGLLTHAVCYKFPKLLEYLYLWYQAKLPLFRDYMIGMERVSCVICPFKSCYELRLGEQHYPDQFNAWRPYIDEIVRALVKNHAQLERAYRVHLWRFYLLHRETRTIANIAHVDVNRPREVQRRASWILASTVVRREDRDAHVVRLRLPVRFWRPHSLVMNIEKVMREHVEKLEERDNMLSLRVSDTDIVLDRSGEVKIAGRDLEKLISLLKLCYMTLSCIECEHCMYNCPRDAISMPFTIDATRCEGCGRCVDSCVPCRYLMDMLLYSELTSIGEAKARIEKIREKYKEILLQMRRQSNIEWLQT